MRPPAQLQCCVYKLTAFCQFKSCADMLTSLLSIGPQSARLRFDCCIYERYTPLLTFTFLAPSVPNQTAKTQSPLEGWKIGRIGWVGFIWLAHLSAGGMDEATFRFRRLGGRTVCNVFRSMLFAFYIMRHIMYSAGSDIGKTSTGKKRFLSGIARIRGGESTHAGFFGPIFLPSCPNWGQGGFTHARIFWPSF